MPEPQQSSGRRGPTVRPRRSAEPYPSSYRKPSTATLVPRVAARPGVALRIAYLFMLACAAYAPIELARLILWHHDTYDQLTLVPIFGLELAVLAWGILGVVVAVAHAWLWVFGYTGRPAWRPRTARVKDRARRTPNPTVPASAE